MNFYLGSWISFALWLIVLILMVKERHHIKAHLTDESMWGSEFGGASRRSMGSRMSNQSFDKMSGRYSNQSGSRYSRSRHYEPTSSINGSYVKQPVVEPPLATSQPTVPLPNSQNAHQSSLMNYFSNPPQYDEAVDVDAAITDSVMDSQQPDSSYFDVPEDNSFESNFPIPVAMDQSDGNDPLPLGDEVSMGVISRESENLSRNDMYKQPPMPNPNRVQGRRGGRRSGGPAHNGFPRTPTTPTAPPTTTYSAEISHREVRRERFEMPQNSSSSSNNYRTQLGQSSMI